MTISAKSRILAVDFGDARTGLAATDWTGSITVPLPRIDSRDQQEVVRAIVELTHERDSDQRCGDQADSNPLHIWTLYLIG